MCQPIVAVELKKVTGFCQGLDKAIAQLDGSLEVYYFNFKMNHYEPFVEKAHFKVLREQTKSSNLAIHVYKTLNVNFSVALFETLF